jgi:hypothetical protein
VKKEKAQVNFPYPNKKPIASRMYSFILYLAFSIIMKRNWLKVVKER